ncbi:hypothetical protein E8E13_011485 [Curvularia kusanoi]|uniref:BRCT domain-containing protein n=1 Tax=Curvularia kusanoi TaxID=90978 RepID=A0A9P4TP82_CURKU|nr:hypothetical protein E8E13_011485 [Curvularia kusanoi]
MAVLKGLTISVAGTLKYDTTQIKKWVEANGGTYTPTIRKGLTHLIASKHAWRSASDAVQTAVDLQAWVVSWDWLEDSLQAHRRRAEKSYSWEFLEQKRKKSRELGKLGARADKKKFEDGCVEARRATGSGMLKNKSPPMPKPKPRSSTRKPRESLTSYLVNDDPAKAVPFVSAAETLKQKKAQREAAKVTKTARATPQASKTSWSLSNKATSTKSHSPSASSASHPLTTTTTTQTPAPENKQAKPPSLKDLYHYYLDATGFEYKILLTRCDLHSNTMQRYQLSILESHTKPNVYCTFIQYYPAAAPNAPGNYAFGGANNVPGTCTSNSSSNGATASELGVLQAVQDFNLSYPSSTTTTSGLNPPPPYTGPPSHHPEAQRLLALTLDPKTAPAPSLSSITNPCTNPHLPSPSPSTKPPDHPYKALLTPLSTPFPTAYLSFRHAFRDLTLLTWEQRFDVDKSLYKRRAQLYDVEPFVYIRPAAV